MSSNAIRLISDSRYEEAKAAEAIKPGHLVKLDVNGDLINHNVEGGLAERAVALEDALQGKTVDDAYAADDVVRYWLPKKGDEMQLRAKAGEATALVIGTVLISNGDGTVKAEADAGCAVADRIGIAVEALDITGGTPGDGDALVAVRIL